MSFRRELHDLVYRPPFENPYDERMTGWGWHEIELAYRMERAGAELVYDPAAGVYHQLHEAATEVTRRGFQRAEEVSRGSRLNELYVREKHGLDDLPWWKGSGAETHP
jgi:hypothetical protein